jgi:4-amino-4-deoxy-L-arabinose transferase-like glycosyltransferase
VWLTSFAITHRQAAIAGALAAVVALAAFLRFYELGAGSVGNTYYAATVRSMLTSWHNFFFASFEPGGSVTVDKPPVGFWLQAASAYVFGVNGFALALPQALAGTLSVPLLFVLVRRHFGAFAALLAALALAVMPIAVATDRNNTIDGLLVFVLLLATWAVLESVRSGRLRWLLLGAVLVGVGFNIKMLQAFAPVPAFYAVYLLAAPHLWWRRLLHLAAATVVLLVVSLSWAVAVDLTPPEDRPYVGSSEDNTVMELITGHNGLSRIISNRGSPPAGSRPLVGGDGPPAFGGTLPPPPDGLPLKPPPNGGPAQRFPDGASPSGALPPAGDGLQGGPPLAGGGGGSVPFSSETGQPGLLRLFSEPLVDEASWLLPLALLAVPLALIALGRLWPLTDKHIALVLWLGWLLPEALYFTYTSGIFHAYYVIMLGPPVAALTGVAAWAFSRLLDGRPWPGATLVAAVVGATLVFQVLTVSSYPDYAPYVITAAVALAVVGLVALAWRPRYPFRLAGPALLLASLLVAPAVWSTATALEDNPDVGLPHSSPESVANPRPMDGDDLSQQQEVTLDYLLANTDPDSYLVATLNAREAAPYILETGRPVLTFGGFGGRDNVVDVDRLAQMVSDGELRFVLAGSDLTRSKPDIGDWLKDSCVPVTLDVEGEQGDPPGTPGGNQNALYDCAPVA